MTLLMDIWMDICIICLNTCFVATFALIKNICVHVEILGVACCFLNTLTAMFYRMGLRYA